VASWNDIIKLLEKVQGKSFAVTYQSTESAQAKETEYWGVGSPMAMRSSKGYGTRKCQGTSRRKNDVFPEVTVTTDLESIITGELKQKGVI
jgi:hypothetical protein